MYHAAFLYENLNINKAKAVDQGSELDIHIQSQSNSTKISRL